MRCFCESQLKPRNEKCFLIFVVGIAPLGLVLNVHIDNVKKIKYTILENVLWKEKKIIIIPVFLSFFQGIRSSPLENSPSPPFASSAPEDGPLLAAQHGGPDPADVNVCPAGPLDGLHLVHHRQDGDGGQFLQLGYR